MVMLPLVDYAEVHFVVTPKGARRVHVERYCRCNRFTLPRWLLGCIRTRQLRCWGRREEGREEGRSWYMRGCAGRVQQHRGQNKASLQCAEVHSAVISGGRRTPTLPAAAVVIRTRWRYQLLTQLGGGEGRRGDGATGRRGDGATGRGRCALGLDGMLYSLADV